jgi:hypothetical protein
MSLVIKEREVRAPSIIHLHRKLTVTNNKTAIWKMIRYRREGCWEVDIFRQPNPVLIRTAQSICLESMGYVTFQ